MTHLALPGCGRALLRTAEDVKTMPFLNHLFKFTFPDAISNGGLILNIAMVKVIKYIYRHQKDWVTTHKR